MQRGSLSAHYVSLIILSRRGVFELEDICKRFLKPLLFFFLFLKKKLYFTFCSSPRPVVVEPLEQYDSEDGLPEKLAQKNPKYKT